MGTFKIQDNNGYKVELAVADGTADRVVQVESATLPPVIGKEFQSVTSRGSYGSTIWTPFVHSPQVISEDFTIVAGANASIVSGTITDGTTITIEDGATVVVL